MITQATNMNEEQIKQLAREEAQNATQEQTRRIIREELAHLIKSDRFTFQRLIQILDGQNIQVATGTGTKIGTAAGQKLSVYGVTPVIQASAISSPTADVNSLKTAVDAIRTALTNFGITA